MVPELGNVTLEPGSRAVRMESLVAELERGAAGPVNKTNGQWGRRAGGGARMKSWAVNEVEGLGSRWAGLVEGQVLQASIFLQV